MFSARSPEPLERGLVQSLIPKNESVRSVSLRQERIAIQQRNGVFHFSRGQLKVLHTTMQVRDVVGQVAKSSARRCGIGLPHTTGFLVPLKRFVQALLLCAKDSQIYP